LPDLFDTLYFSGCQIVFYICVANFLLLRSGNLNENIMSEDKMKKKPDNQEQGMEQPESHKPGNNGMEEERIEELTNEDEKHEDKKKKSKKEHKSDRFQELEEKFIELSDKHLRLQAEFDNFRRRTMKEKVDLIKSGGETVLTGILPVIDDFERALQSLKEVPEDDPGKKGTLLIYSKFREFLKQNNVKEIDAINQNFDVDLHEALTKIPAPEENLKGKVVDVVQKGYLLNEKVIRYAKVVVGE
jgi:molecular chaperone GrpE